MRKGQEMDKKQEVGAGLRKGRGRAQAWVGEEEGLEENRWKRDRL